MSDKNENTDAANPEHDNNPDNASKKAIDTASAPDGDIATA